MPTPPRRILQCAAVAACFLLLPPAGHAQVIGEVMYADGFDEDQTGWMGYAALGNGDLQNALVFNRGFPWCNATDQNGNLRTDDVGDDPNSGLTCVDRHLWGDASSCSIGNFHDLDADQWARRFDHSWVASATS